MKNLFTKLALLAVLLCTASLSHAECYQPANASGAGVPADCVSVDAYINAAGQAVPFSTGDVCQNPYIAKSAAILNISSATTTSLVNAVAGKKIYLCTFNAVVSGTSPTLQFISGTQTTTACDTAPNTLSGVMPFTSGYFLDIDNIASSFTGSAGGQLCVVSGGTTPSVQGFIIYVQQ